MSPVQFSADLIIEQIGSIPKITAVASTGKPSAVTIDARQTNAPPGTPGEPIDNAITVTKTVNKTSEVNSTPYIFANIMLAIDR